MITKQIEELTLESFIDFGKFARVVNPSTPKLGQKPVEFFRDILQLDLGHSTRASFSVLRAERRPEIIDAMEYHNTAAEMNLPLDNDILLYVAPASAPDGFRSEDVRVFRVPLGTMVVINVGVWHQAIFVDHAEYVNVLVALPERLYANDCFVYNMKESEKIIVKR